MNGKMSKEEESFLADLQALMKAHGVKLSEWENYGYDENHEGSTFYFTGDNVHLEVDEMLNKTLPAYNKALQAKS